MVALQMVAKPTATLGDYHVAQLLAFVGHGHEVADAHAAGEGILHR